MLPDRASPAFYSPALAGEALDSELEEGESTNPSTYPSTEAGQLHRHTCATLLLAAGEHPKIVSERLGHSSVTLTLDTYSHVLPDMQEATAAKLENLLFG